MPCLWCEIFNWQAGMFQMQVHENACRNDGIWWVFFQRGLFTRVFGLVWKWIDAILFFSLQATTLCGFLFYFSLRATTLLCGFLLDFTLQATTLCGFLFYFSLRATTLLCGFLLDSTLRVTTHCVDSYFCRWCVEPAPQARMTTVTMATPSQAHTAASSNRRRWCEQVWSVNRCERPTEHHNCLKF